MTGAGSLTTGGVSVPPPVVVVSTGAFETGFGQSYPLCFPLLSFLQSPKVALTGLCAPPPLAAELTPTNGDPTIRQALAARDTRTRLAVRLPVVERCIIIRGAPYPNPTVTCGLTNLESRQPSYLAPAAPRRDP